VTQITEGVAFAEGFAATLPTGRVRERHGPIFSGVLLAGQGFYPNSPVAQRYPPLHSNVRVMWGTVFLLALMMAPDPLRLGTALLLISGRRPLLNLLAFWLGGMLSGLAGLGELTLLRNSLPAIAHNATSMAASYMDAHTRIVIGVLALLIAALTTVRFRVRVPIGGGATSARVPRIPTPFSRLSALSRHALEGGYPWAVFVVGLTSAIPPVEYLVALTVILASGAAMGAQLSAALMYTVVVLALIEVPLVSYLVAPAKTQAVVLQLQNWVRARRRQIFVVIATVAGVWLVTAGICGG
jgi:hypothetical protein